MILLHTIRRAFAENLKVFKCKPCGFSTTKPASWTTRLSPQNVSADRRTPAEITGTSAPFNKAAVATVANLQDKPADGATNANAAFHLPLSQCRFLRARLGSGRRPVGRGQQ